MLAPRSDLDPAPGAAPGESATAAGAGTDGAPDGEGAGRGAGPTLAVALAACGALCLWGLGSRSIWLDEAITRAATAQLVETLDRTAGTMGAYYVLLTGWTGVVGDSVVALRLPSVAFLLGAVAVTARLALRILPRQEALVATVVVALSPGLVRHGQEARSYALVVLVAVASWACLARALEAGGAATGAAERDGTGAGRWWLAVTVLSVAGTSAHGLYVLQLAAQAASLAVVPGLRPQLRRLVPATVGTLALVVLQLGAGAEAIASWIPPLHPGQVTDAGALLLGPTWPTALGVLLLAACGAGVALRRPAADPLDRWRAVAPVVWGVVPVGLLLVVSVARPYFLGRYVLASVPALAMLVATGAVHLDRTVRWRGGRRLAPGLVTVAAIGLLLAGQVVLHVEGGEDDDWRAAARVVAADAAPDDAVVFTLPELKLALDAEWAALPSTPPAPTVVYPRQVLGEARRFEQPMDPDEVADDVAAHPRVWLVHRTMQGGGDRALEGTLALVTGPRFRTVAHHHLGGGVQVLLLERTAG